VGVICRSGEPNQRAGRPLRMAPNTVPAIIERTPGLCHEKMEIVWLPATDFMGMTHDTLECFALANWLEKRRPAFLARSVRLRVHETD